ncbi:MAG: CcmD family protein [Nitrospirae bacterium]|nr:MAG: CcmD family protein [Nitrospirota bacterium]
MGKLFYLFGAYSVAWLVLMAYLLVTIRRINRLDEKITDLEQFIRR